MQTNLMQCAAYDLITDRLTPTPSTSAAMLAALHFPNTTSGYDAEHEHSTFFVDHGKACSEWNLSC